MEFHNDRGTPADAGSGLSDGWGNGYFDQLDVELGSFCRSKFVSLADFYQLVIYDPFLRSGWFHKPILSPD
jgi:hypothetical protein